MKLKMLFFIILTIAAVIIGVGYATDYFERKSQEKPTVLELNGKSIKLEVVDTEPTRTQGLSNRQSLPADSAMLFIFDDSDIWGIWMKDMHFSIDIIFLDEQFNVINAYRNISPETYPAVYRAQRPALYVLETNAGFVERNNIQLNQRLLIK
jgi:uncharacterized protein